MNTTIRVYTRSFTIPADAIDENGHVNNVAYVRWMQDIAGILASIPKKPEMKVSFRTKAASRWRRSAGCGTTAR